MTYAHLIAAVCANDQQMFDLARGGEPTDQVERRSVAEVQVVEEDNEGLEVGDDLDKI